MAYPATKRQRCITEIKQRLRKGHGIIKAMRLVSDLEGLPEKTLQSWWYPYIKKEKESQEQVETKRQEKWKPLVGTVLKSEVSRLDPPAPPKPAYVVTSGAQLRCSKCKNRHLEKREDSYFCPVCQSLLPAPTWGDYEIKTVSNNPDPFGWMR